jgi:hypothetical protein
MKTANLNLIFIIFLLILIVMSLFYNYGLLDIKRKNKYEGILHSLGLDNSNKINNLNKINKSYGVTPKKQYKRNKSISFNENVLERQIDNAGYVKDHFIKING